MTNKKAMKFNFIAFLNVVIYYLSPSPSNIIICKFGLCLNIKSIY